MLAVGVLYARHFTEFDHTLTPNAREFLGNSSWIWLGVRSLKDGELPLWNHYLGTGLPYLGDPFSHLFSPLALLPALFLGAEDGPRLAMPLTIVAAGFAQYYFAHTLRLSTLARVFSALVYMLNGAMAVRWEAGHFDFGLAYPYLPLSFALLVKCMTTERGALYPVLGGAALAGLLFAGNVYYVLFAAPGLVICAAFYAIDLRRGGALSLRWGAAGRAVAMAAWALGFSAIQWLPWLATDGYISKPVDRALNGSPELLGSLRGLFRSDLRYYDASSDGRLGGLWYEYYAYAGVLLIPLFVISPLALWTRARAWAMAVTLFVFYILWASAAHTPFEMVYQRFPRLYDFRHTSRVLAAAVPFAALIPALALDAVWRFATRLADALPSRARVLAARAAIATALAAFALFALRDEYRANSERFAWVPANHALNEVGAWLEDASGQPFLYDLPDGTWGITPPLHDGAVKRSRPPWGWTIRHTESQITPDTPAVQLLPKPRYIIFFRDAPPPVTGRPVASVADRIVYEFPDAPPYAGFVRRDDASRNRAAFEAPHTQPDQFARWPFDDPAAAEAAWIDNNQTRVRGAPSLGQDTLVVLEAYMPGWRVEVDGRRAGDALNVGGLIGAPARPGEHTYVFVFDPWYARPAVAVTMGTILGALLLFARGPATAWWRRRARRRLSAQEAA